MRALSLHQPHATLVAAGVKWLETRSWRTSYTGPLLVHAAKSTATIDALPGDCEGKIEGGWVYGYVGDYQASYCRHPSDEGERGATMLADSHTGDIAPLPLGAYVAVVHMAACLPILDLARPDVRDPGHWLWDFERDALVITQHRRLVIVTGEKPWLWRVCTDQAPYGHFEHGRWAWVWCHAQALPEPIPARGRQGLWTPDSDVAGQASAHTASVTSGITADGDTHHPVSPIRAHLNRIRQEDTG